MDSQNINGEIDCKLDISLNSSSEYAENDSFSPDDCSKYKGVIKMKIIFEQFNKKYDFNA